MSFNEFLSDLKSKRTTQVVEDSKAELQRYLKYELKFGKYKGMTYEQVYIDDFNYFTYVVKNMNKETKTYKVLSVLLE